MKRNGTQHLDDGISSFFNFYNSIHIFASFSDRMEQDGEKKVGALLQTVDELVKIAPDLVPGGALSTTSAVTQYATSR